LIIDNRAWRKGAVDYDLVRGWLWATSDTLPYGSNSSEIPVADFAGDAVSVGRVRQAWPPFIPAKYNARGEYYTKPIVLLIGPVQSEAEVVPITVRNRRRGTLVGTATAGTTGFENSVALPGGGRFTFSTARTVNPDGSLYNHVGVLPDIVVVPTIEGIRAGRDEGLDAGLAALRRALSMPHAPQ
jgi:C-terminal processing protease CtpA/Prc